MVEHPVHSLLLGESEKNEMLEQFGVSTHEMRIFKTPIYFEDYLRTAAYESNAEFVQSMQIIQCVAKTY